MSTSYPSMLTSQEELAQLSLSLDTRIKNEQRHRQFWIGLLIITILLLCFGGLVYSNSENPSVREVAKRIGINLPSPTPKTIALANEVTLLGPAGVTGPKGLDGVAGLAGMDGKDGINGINTVASFSLPRVGIQGIYGSNSTTPIIVTDGQGRIVSINNTPIQVDVNAITGAGSISGSGSVVVTGGTGTVLNNVAIGLNPNAIDKNTLGGSALTIANGGTGLSTLGDAGQILTMNAGGTALQYSSLPNTTPSWWNLTGNVGTTPGTNFIGTNDNQPLIFKTNNTQTGFISSNGSSIQFGAYAGGGAASLTDTLFIGINSGFGATGSNNSQFLGKDSGYGATNAAYSQFIGNSAGINATNAATSLFIGTQAGSSATNASISQFVGFNAGNSATNANNSQFFGGSSGFSAVNAYSSQFIGEQAGRNATNAHYSQFIGEQAGSGATDASFSTFVGSFSGLNATNAATSLFLGVNAGSGATNASNSQFVGRNSGVNSINAKNSIFIGENSGSFETVDNSSGSTSILIGKNSHTGGFINSIALGGNVINTASDQFLIGSTYTNLSLGGVNYIVPTAQASAAGQVLTNNGSGLLTWSTPSGGGGGGGGAGWSLTGNAGTIPGTNFIGTTDNQDLIFKTNNVQTGRISANGLNISFGLNAGSSLTDGNNIMIGDNAGLNGTYVSDSQFIGSEAGYQAENAFASQFIGSRAGYQATNAYDSQFIGNRAGYKAVEAESSVFIGDDSGKDATYAYLSTFVGSMSGMGATNASDSTFVGQSAGWLANNANDSTFLGLSAGEQALNSSYSVFLGQSAGRYASNAKNSQFLGYKAGYNAVNANKSLFLGEFAGNNDTVNNSVNSGTSILIGNSTNTGGFSNSIALGTSAVNTASNQFLIAPAYTKLSIGGVNYVVPTAQATAPGQVLANDGVGNLFWGNAPGGPVTSDQRLKKNIQMFTLGLDAVTSLDTKTFQYNGGTVNAPDDGITHVGVLAQQVNNTALAPYMVSTGTDGYFRVDSTALTYATVNAIKELNDKVKSLQAQVDLLASKTAGIDYAADATFTGHLTLNTATFGGVVVFSKDVSILGNLDVTGSVTVSKDTADRAVVITGTRVAHVLYSKAQISIPVVVFTAIGNAENAELTNVTVNGFDITLPVAADRDITFNWHSFLNK